MGDPVEDPEFHLNSYYKRKMKQKKKVTTTTAAAAVPQRRLTKRTVSPPTVYGFDDGDIINDLLWVLFFLFQIEICHILVCLLFRFDN